MALQDTYKKARLVMKPAAMKEGKLYSQQPHSGDGDFTFSRANGTQTRINKHGLIETVDDNTPRLSYSLDDNGDVSECPALLLEPSRTNNILQSNDPSGANWTDPLSRWTLLSDTTAAPDGSSVRIIELTEDGGSLIRLTGFSVSAGTYTLSFYIKDIDGNLTGGNVDVGDEGSGAPSPTFGDVGGDWVRATRTITTTATRTHVDLQPTFSGGTNKVAIWGVQLEAGSYPTSLIPTEGSAAQREQDKCLNGGDVNLFNDSEGTLFLDIENFSGNTRELTLSNGTSSNRVAIIFYGASNVIRFYVANSSGAQADSIFTLSYTFDQRNKIAFKYKQNDFKAYINGVQVFSDPSGNTPIGLSRFDFATASAASNFIEGKIHQAMILNEALSDSELIELTS